jgi:hypothetical protein
MKPVGKPDAGNRHVRFDERGEETGRCRMAQVTAPLLDSTRSIRATLIPYAAALCRASSALYNSNSSATAFAMLGRVRSRS